MPELPEVEAARKILDAGLVGKKLTEVTVRPDEIVLEGRSPEDLTQLLTGQTVARTGRKGKFFWLEFAEGAGLALHLGMTGAVLDLTPGRERSVNYYRSRNEATSDGPPRFLKLQLHTDTGESLAMVDGRRLARIWPIQSPDTDPRIARLGPDSYLELPDPAGLAERLGKRKAAIKALLLDQAILSGIGNYLADEILYAARIHPAKGPMDFTTDEFNRLHIAIRQIVGHAVAVDADYQQFPPDWLFHVRWGGDRGETEHLGRTIRREKIGGRTTAYVPEIQI